MQNLTTNFKYGEADDYLCVCHNDSPHFDSGLRQDVTAMFKLRETKILGVVKERKTAIFIESLYCTNPA